MRRALCELALTPASIRPLGLDARRSPLFDLTTEDGRRLLVDGEGRVHLVGLGRACIGRQQDRPAGVPEAGA